MGTVSQAQLVNILLIRIKYLFHPTMSSKTTNT